MVQPPLVVIQPEQERTDELVLPRLVPAKAGDDAVGGARVLHFDHRALAGLVRPVRRFRDHAVQARTLEARQPLGCLFRIARHRRQMNRRFGTGEQPLQLHAAFALRHVAQIPSVCRKRVERDKRGGRFFRELRDARRGGMKPQLKGVEIETAGRGDHDLAIDHAAIGQAGEERRVQLGKVPVERPQVAALDEHVPAATEDDGAKPVPFRLVESRRRPEGLSSLASIGSMGGAMANAVVAMQTA